jgi:hypothetical protein
MKKILSLFAFVAIVISFAACGGNDGNVPGGGEEPKATVLGKFSVGEGKQVYFSQGNLWFSKNPLTMQRDWTFAANQWDTIGSTSMMLYRDLLSWEEINESPDFDHWTINTVRNGEGYTWRVLSREEWDYLFARRPNAAQLFTYAKVHGVNGVLLLPDDWNNNNGFDLVYNPLDWEGDEDNGYYYLNNNSIHGNIDFFAFNTINDRWTALQNLGAVFLPAAGLRDDEEIWDVGEKGYYWSSTLNEEYEEAYYVFFSDLMLDIELNDPEYYRYSIRPVRDVE